MDGFRVDAAALQAHAAAVDGCAGRVRQAAAAATPLDLHAYGLVGQVFAASAATATATAADSVARLAASAQALGDGVRSGLHDYLDTERRAASRFELREPGR